VPLRGSEPAPDTKLLASGQGIVETVDDEGTLSTQSLSDLDRFRTDLAVVDVFREVDAWQALAGYFPHLVNFQQEFGVWVSGVDHRVELSERKPNVLY
jgi:hypothetical protein